MNWAKIIIGDSRQMEEVEDNSIGLIVTSPPYWHIKDYGSEGQIGYGQSLHEYLKLYTKITEVIRAEIDEVSEEDCINYICNLVINRTFEGFQTEVETIYKLLERELSVKIKPAPDEWDRLYNSPNNQTPEIHKGKEWLGHTHKNFEEKFGGKVFIKSFLMLFATSCNQHLYISDAVY
jgi:hypothetical protein